jgi:diguanylate cyclase (GGDEF)-like protein
MLMDRYDLTRSADNKLWDWDLLAGRIHYSLSWISMLGGDESEFGNTPEEWFNRIHPEDLELVKREIEAHLEKSSAQFEIQHRLLHKDGCYRWMLCQGMIKRDDTGKAIRIAGCHLNITPDKVVDPLTGLPNRFLLLDRLARSIEKAKKNESFHFAVLIVDLDLFESGINRLETINSNSLIVAAARRLETSLRDRNSDARHEHAHLVTHSGGEDFIILLDGLRDVKEARSAAEELLKEMLAPFELDGREVSLSPSIGIALSATGYRSAEDALRDADTALYRAKAFGKSRCEVFDTAILESTQSRHQLEMDLQQALSRKELLVFYQPIMDLSSNHIVGLEALVRWKHPTRGLIPPMEFIPVAEKIGFIVPLDRWVMQNACRQLKAWQKKQVVSKNFWISVNLSGEQLVRASLAKEVREILIETGLDADSLMLELTERAAMKNPETAQRLLMQLRVMGVKIALDDFGAGYSSLSQLRRLPLDFLKIDHLFVRSLENNPDTREIIRAISAMAQQLGLQVIAEGIENSRQKGLLQSLNCRYGQGFLFSKAVGSEQAEALLRDGMVLPGDKCLPAALPEKANEKGKPSSQIVPMFPAQKISPEARGERLLSPKSKYILIGLPALILLLMGGFLARLNRLTSPPVAYSSQPSSPAEAEKTAKAAVLPGSAEIPPIHESPKTASANRSSTPPTSAPKAAWKKPPPAVYTYPVVHDHRFGSCMGVIRITGEGISFVSEKVKDSFNLSYSECSLALDRDQLTIKAGSKVLHFKSATARTKDENRSHLTGILQSISTLHQAK